MGIVKNRRTAGARMRLSLDRWAGCRWAAQTGGEGRGGELGCRGCPENPCNDGVVRGGHQGQKARGVSFFGFFGDVSCASPVSRSLHSTTALVAVWDLAGGGKGTQG